MELASRHALYRKMDAIIHDEMPLVPFAYYVRIRLVHPLVKNWPDNILDSRPWAAVGFGNAP